MTWVEKGLEKDKAGGLNGSKGDKNGKIPSVHCVRLTGSWPPHSHSAVCPGPRSVLCPEPAAGLIALLTPSTFTQFPMN